VLFDRDHSPQNGAAVLPMPTPHLSGKNSVSELVVKQGKAGTWIAEFDYFFNANRAPRSRASSWIPPRKPRAAARMTS
jgi:hypothetical protein